MGAAFIKPDTSRLEAGKFRPDGFDLIRGNAHADVLLCLLPFRSSGTVATLHEVKHSGYIFGLCEDPRGRYVCVTPEGAQEVVQRRPDWSEFVEACFTPGSELNRRLKQMILNMGEEEKHK